MARIYMCGYEYNNLTYEPGQQTITGSPTIQSTTVNNGSKYAMTSASGNYHMVYLYNIAKSGTYFIRAYIRISSSNTSSGVILHIGTGVGGQGASIVLNSDNTLNLKEEWGGTTQGSASSALTANTWYYVEMTVTGSTLTAKLNGTQFATGTGTNSGTIDRIQVGVQSGGGTVIFDDIAVNDNSGTNQNSYPDVGSIVHLYPTGAGDNTGLPTQFPSSGAHWDKLKEVPPDDATTYVGLANTTTSGTDDYTVTSAATAGIGSNDTITCIGLMVRWTSNWGSARDPSFKTRIKASSGGTVDTASNSNYLSSTTAWFTGNDAFNDNLTLPPMIHVSYTKPSSTAWTPSDLSNAQIGIQSVNASGGSATDYCTSLIAMVDHVPVANTAPVGKDIMPEQNTLGAVILQAVNRAGTY